jgi:predicted nucleotidyltransferase component of viral defense system
MDTMWVAPGWHLQTVNVGFKGGAPLGSLTYVEAASSRRIDVAVRWDHVHDQLQCSVIDRATAQSELNILERDARARVGALLRVSAELGWRFASSEMSRTDILKAAGLSPASASGPRAETETTG